MGPFAGVESGADGSLLSSESEPDANAASSLPSESAFEMELPLDAAKAPAAAAAVPPGVFGAEWGVWLETGGEKVVDL